MQWRSDGLGVALAGALVLTLKNTLFTPIYGAYIQKLRWYRFLLNMVPGILAAILVGGVCYGLAVRFSLDSWLDLIGVGAGMAVVYAVVVYFLVINRDDRALFKSFLPGTLFSRLRKEV